MHRLSALRGGFLVLLMLCAPLSGCIGEKDGIDDDEVGYFLIDSMKPSQAKLYTGQWHDFLLVGQGKAISVPTSVLLFIDGTVVSNGYAVVEGDQLTGRLLLTPYSNNVILTIVDSNGKEGMYPQKRVTGRIFSCELEPMERNIAMVFQNYALYPHMSVFGNMAYGLKIAKISKEEINSRVQKAAEILELEELLKRKPNEWVVP